MAGGSGAARAAMMRDGVEAVVAGAGCTLQKLRVLKNVSVPLPWLR